jgi:hypothetical protein
MTKKYVRFSIHGDVNSMRGGGYTQPAQFRDFRPHICTVVSKLQEPVHSHPAQMASRPTVGEIRRHRDFSPASNRNSQNGDIDGNPETEADATWLPFAATPPHPEFPSAHGCANPRRAGRSRLMTRLAFLLLGAHIASTFDRFGLKTTALIA